MTDALLFKPGTRVRVLDTCPEPRWRGRAGEISQPLIAYASAYVSLDMRGREKVAKRPLIELRFLTQESP